MKKTLSIVLAAAMLLAFANVAFAANEENVFKSYLHYSAEAGEFLDTPEKITEMPMVIYVDDAVLLTGGVDGKTYTWKLTTGISGYRLSMVRGELYEEANWIEYPNGSFGPDASLDERVTIGEEAMYIVGRAVGKVTVEVYDGATLVDSWVVYVQAPPRPDEDRDPLGFFEILRVFWNDLMWTWLYEIHPMFKFLYFTAMDLIKNGLAVVGDWFNSIFNPDVVVVTKW